MPPSFDSSAASHRPGDWRTIARLLPYLWEYKWRVIIAIACMVAAKSANVGVPLLLKQLIDAMDVPAGSAQALLVVPVGLLVAYGALRFANSLFNELREFVFSKATHGAARSIALATFEHLHRLSLRFHLERQTGGMTRDIERGVRGIESLVSFAFFNIVATLVEVLLVLTVLGNKLDIGFALITLAALTALKCPQELKGHVRGALNNGCTVEEIREALLHCAVYAGVPAAIDAFRAAQEVIDSYQKPE